MKFKELRNYNCIVLNFESNTRLPKAAKGMSDYLIIAKKHIYFIERKSKGDRYSSEQINFRNAVENLNNKSIKYILWNGEQPQENSIIDKILQEN